MNGNLYLFPVQMPELQEMLRSIVRDELAALKRLSDNQKEPEIIDREVLCERLNISLPTVIRWQKKGKIPYLMVGSSIRYNWPKVIEALEKKGGRR